MNIDIINPAEDQYGNSKNNIFIAFGADGGYLGNAYVFPGDINHRQIEEVPYLIYMSINVEDHVGEGLKKEVKQELFDKVFGRAKEIRMEKPDLIARIYAGFEYDEANMEFYVENGFHEDYSILMEATIEDDFTYKLPKGMEVIEIDVGEHKELNDYNDMYDAIFISPLDTGALAEQSKRNCFKNLYFSVDGRRCGGCTIFEKDGLGYIETMYVLPDARGKGISKTIMSYIFDYFLANGLNKTKLEVWELNRRALKLYESFGYKEAEKCYMFPGITL